MADQPKFKVGTKYHPLPKFNVGAILRHRTNHCLHTVFVREIRWTEEGYQYHVSPRSDPTFLFNDLEAEWMEFDPKPAIPANPQPASVELPNPAQDTGHPRRISTPSYHCHGEYVHLGDAGQEALQAGLLTALQERAMACRDCGHIFQPGDAKRSVQRTANVTALCESCWQLRLRHG